MPVFLKTSRVLSFRALANENKNKIRFRILISLLYIRSELKLCLGSCKVSELKLRSFLKYLLQKIFFISVVHRNYEVKKSFNITEKKPQNKTEKSF